MVTAWSPLLGLGALFSVLLFASAFPGRDLLQSAPLQPAFFVVGPFCGHVCVQHPTSRQLLNVAYDAGKSVNNLPLVQGSGSTAAAAVWRSIIANASATGNAPMSLTYDAVGSGQVRHQNICVPCNDHSLLSAPLHVMHKLSCHYTDKAHICRVRRISSAGHTTMLSAMCPSQQARTTHWSARLCRCPLPSAPWMRYTPSRV